MVAGAVLPLNLSHFAMGRLAVSGDRYHGPVPLARAGLSDWQENGRRRVIEVGPLE